MNDINNKEITKDNPIRKIVKHISILGNPKGFFNGNETKLDSSNGRKGIRERFNEEIKPTLELKINKLKKIVSPTKATAIPKSKFGTGQTVTMNDLSNSMDTLNISTTPPPQKKESKKSSKTGK